MVKRIGPWTIRSTVVLVETTSLWRGLDVVGSYLAEVVFVS